MNRILEYLFICLSLIFLSGCGEVDDDITVEVISKDIAVSSADQYVLELGSFGDEDGAYIKVQANHYEISQINFDKIVRHIPITLNPKQVMQD